LRAGAERSADPYLAGAAEFTAGKSAGSAHALRGAKNAGPLQEIA